MQQKIHPGIAFGVILVVIGVASYLLWYPNRARPIPDHFGPVSLGQARQMQAGPAAKTVTTPGNPGIKASAKPHGSPAAKDSKSADGK